MSWENEVADLRFEMKKLKRRHSQGEEIHRLCRGNYEQLTEFRAETSLKFEQVDRRIFRLESDVSTLKSDVSILKSNVSTLKTDVSTLKSDVSTLKSDVSTLKSDVSTMKSDISDIKAILLKK